MKIRFPNEITLNCVEILVCDYEGEECTLDMECNVIFQAGQEFDEVEIDEETPADCRIWIRDDLVALKVKWSEFEVIEL